MHSQQRVGRHLRAEVVGGRTGLGGRTAPGAGTGRGRRTGRGGRSGLGGQQRGDGSGVAGDRLLFACEQGRAVSDHAADRAEPCERFRIAGFDLCEQPALVHEGAAERGEHRLASRPGADRVGQPGAEGLQPPVEQVFLGGEVVEDRRLRDLRLPRNLGDSHPVEPPVGEQPPRGVGDQLPRLLLLQLAKPHAPILR